MADQEQNDSGADLLLGALRQVIDGLVATFGPHCEIVLHDYRKLETSVVAIAGSVTSRKVGGAMSEIGLELLSQGDAAQDKVNYITRTADGRTIKSSTMLLRDAAGHVFGAFCVNLDITELRLAVTSLTAIIGDTANPAPTTTLFSDDIRDVITAVITQEEQRLGKRLSYDTRQGRLEVMKALDVRGIFHVPRAVNVVGQHLGVSRATVYADLNTIRGFPAENDNT
ncbi:helix-turn-helix transcriptional regulator [Nonomuraea sp. NPDC003707]